MTDNARLLFAAARGARVQISYDNKKDWSLSDYAQIRGREDFIRRIHPADEHLQYGPVSAQLREAAENPPEFLGDVGDPASMHIWTECLAKFYEDADDLHKAIFLLLLSESLADFGL